MFNSRTKACNNRIKILQKNQAVEIIPKLNGMKVKTNSKNNSIAKRALPNDSSRSTLSLIKPVFI